MGSFLPMKANYKSRSAKRGTHGPSPKRVNHLWDSGAARRASGLVVTEVATGKAVAVGGEQDQGLLARYADARMARVLAAADARGLRPDTMAWRRFVRRAAEGLHEKWVRRVCR